MLLSKPDYGELPLCNTQFSQGRTQYFRRMTNKRLWLASAINKHRLEVMCSGHILKMPLSASQIIELTKNCKMRIEEREIYGFEGSYNEEDIIIPNIKLNIHNELVYKREKQSTQYRIESKGEISTKDWLYLILYLFLTIILVIFLDIFAYLVFRLFEKRNQRVEEIHVEDGYVPMYPLVESKKKKKEKERLCGLLSDCRGRCTRENDGLAEPLRRHVRLGCAVRQCAPSMYLP